MGSPDFSLLINQWWGGAFGDTLLAWDVAAASNIVGGTNPPYTVADFLAKYPKFGGIPTNITGTLASGSNSVTAVSSVVGLAAGQLVTGVGVAGGSIITAVGGGTLTLSANATANITGEALTVYTAPFVPLAVLQMYIAFASASLAQERWLDWWPQGMAFFIAHYLTLYLRSDGDPATTAGAAASAGMILGFQTSRTVGPVSVSQENLLSSGWESWGAYQLTLPGQQFITLAAVVGFGGIYVY